MRQVGEEDLIEPPFNITPQNKPFLFSKIDRLDLSEGWQVVIQKKKSKRSNQQNRWMRGLAKDFGAHCGYTEDQMYEIFMLKFCPEFVVDPETGEELRMPGHFSKDQDGKPRSTEDAAEIQSQVLQWVAECGFLWDERH